MHWHRSIYMRRIRETRGRVWKTKDASLCAIKTYCTLHTSGRGVGEPAPWPAPLQDLRAPRSPLSLSLGALSCTRSPTLDLHRVDSPARFFTLGGRTLPTSIDARATHVHDLMERGALLRPPCPSRSAPRSAPAWSWRRAGRARQAPGSAQPRGAWSRSCSSVPRWRP